MTHRPQDNSTVRHHQFISFNCRRADDLLTYALPEDTYMEGLIQTPLQFCVYPTVESPLTAAIVTPTIRDANLSPFVCYRSSSEEQEKCPIFFGPLGTSDVPRVSPESVKVYRSRSTGDLTIAMNDDERKSERGRSYSATNSDFDTSALHLHINAISDCGDKPQSLIRLARLLVIASSLPEFQRAFPAVNSEKLSELQTLQEKMKLQRMLGCATSDTLEPSGERQHKRHQLLDIIGSKTTDNMRGLLRVNLDHHVVSSSDQESHQIASNTEFHNKKAMKFRSSRKKEDSSSFKYFPDSVDAGQQLLATIQGTPKRLIVIDGSNVAHRYGGLLVKKFSSQGIQIAVDYYLSRGFEVGRELLIDMHLSLSRSWRSFLSMS